MTNAKVTMTVPTPDETTTTSTETRPTKRSRTPRTSGVRGRLDEWDSTCDPGQLRLNLVAAVAGSQNPRNAHVLEHLFERWRAFQLDVSTADDVTRAAELRFLAHHPAECAAAALALAVIHRAWSRTRSRVRALKAELLAEGVDLTHVDDKVETLSYLRRMRDKGTLALGLEACAARRAEAEVRFLGPNALASWREYYGERDIDLARASDMERVRRYVADLHHLEGCLLGIDLQATASEGGGFGGGMWSFVIRRSRRAVRTVTHTRVRPSSTPPGARPGARPPLRSLPPRILPSAPFLRSFCARRVVQSASITLSSLGICDMAVTCRLICRMVEVTMSMDVNPMDTPAAARV